jgi:hypothetical protein
VTTRVRLGVLLLLTLALGSCTLETPDLFVRGEPYILSGTAAVIDRGGPCPVWLGENGTTYHLFQGGRVANEDFDRVRTPGVTSRLEIATRSDLYVDCQVGTIVEVERILEIVE